MTGWARLRAARCLPGADVPLSESGTSFSEAWTRVGSLLSQHTRVGPGRWGCHWLGLTCCRLVRATLNLSSQSRAGRADINPASRQRE